MKAPFDLLSILIIGLTCLSAVVETKTNAIYYVSPTEPLSSCPGNSSCPPGQLCHTMDYLAEHSSEFFSPDHVNVTLIFMCGVHNYIKDLTVQNLCSFVMKGTAESRENVVIDYRHRLGEKLLGKSKCTTIRFFNVSFVSISTLTVMCPAISLKDSHITVKRSDVYGNSDEKESLSLITITGKDSQAFFDSCTFKENCFIVSNFSDGITLSNSIFQSYKHQIRPIIMALSSVVTNGKCKLHREFYGTSSIILIWLCSVSNINSLRA